MGVFSAKFLTTPSGKTIDGTQKSLWVKWWHRPPLSSCKIWWKSNNARRRESTGCGVFHFFVYNAPQITVAGDLVTLLQQEIASVFVGRFRCGLQRFSGKKSPFQWREQIWKLSLGSATNGAPMRGKIYKIWKKWVQSLCAPLRPFRSELKENFFQNILSHVL